MDKENIKAGAYRGGSGDPGPPGSQKGAPKRKKKGKEKKQREKERKKRKRREKDRKNERNRGQERKNKGKSTRRKLGSREENFRGAKLTAKRDKNNEHFQTYFIIGI